MEPLSAFYNSPLVVLDFQSLYPSVMVAYNYCYSTCLGRVAPFKGQYKFGVAETKLPPGLLATLENHITSNGTRSRNVYQSYSRSQLPQTASCMSGPRCERVCWDGC
jgi:DNA polymerase elongation subunit (family B)